jgi:hypothetical protein
VSNNIFYVLGTTSYLSMPQATFDSNVFYGHHPSSEPRDAHKLTNDPMLVAPGSASIGRATVDGYMLRAGSPALGTGVSIANNGGKDYWGNDVSSATPPHRGAYAGPAVANVAYDVAFNTDVVASSSFENDAWGTRALTDGQTQSVFHSQGYSSQLGIHQDHGEWIEVRFGYRATFSKVVLHPRSDPGHVGDGFPVDFVIQVWNGTTWVDRLWRGHEPIPTTKQEYTWGHSDTTDRLRIYATRTRLLGADYVFQLAEVEVF